MFLTRLESSRGADAESADCAERSLRLLPAEARCDATAVDIPGQGDGGQNTSAACPNFDVGKAQYKGLCTLSFRLPAPIRLGILGVTLQRAVRLRPCTRQVRCPEESDSEAFILDYPWLGPPAMWKQPPSTIASARTLSRDRTVQTTHTDLLADPTFGSVIEAGCGSLLSAFSFVVEVLERGPV
jgi:hypothetical protein